MAANVAGISLALVDGADLAARIDPRFVELRLTEKREADADELELTLQNVDGALEIPEPNRDLTLKLGWKSGSAVTTGLIDKGRFTVDEVSQEGPPDKVTIRARSADLTGRYRQRRTTSWRDTTLGAILAEIARRHDREARVAPALAAAPVAAIEQEGKSDMAFVRDLGRRYDAIATWKAGLLIFAPIGASASVSGVAMPVATLTKVDGWSWRFTRAERDAGDGAEAQWHDPEEGRRKTVKVGDGGEGGNRRKLKRVYASEAEATRAATSTAQRAARQPYSFEYELAIADPALQPDQRIRLQGWGQKIDAIEWLIATIETTLGPNGLSQSITMESA